MTKPYFLKLKSIEDLKERLGFAENAQGSFRNIRTLTELLGNMIIANDENQAVKEALVFAIIELQDGALATLDRDAIGASGAT